MIKITFEDLTVDLNDTQLSIVRTSPYPLVATGNQAGNFIFNFNLPATPELKRKFKFANRPQAANPFIEVPYRINGSGLLFEGTATVKEMSSDNYEVSCTVSNGDFNVDAKKVKLTELDLGGDRLIDFHQIYTIASTGGSIHRTHFALNPFTETIIPKFTNVQIDTGPSLNADGSSLTINSYSAISLVFSFIAEITQGMATFNIYKDGNLYDSIDILENQQNSYVLPADDGQVITWDLVLNSEELNDPGTYGLDVQISISLNAQAHGAPFDPNVRYPDADFAIFPIENPEVFSNWDDDFYAVDNLSIKTLYNQFFKVINYFANGVFPFSMSGIVDGTELTAGNIFTPFPYIAYLVKRIATHFNYRIENNPFDDELQYCVLINHFCENRFQEGSTKFITLKDGFDLKDHVPDWSVYDFFKHLCNLFGMGYEVEIQRRIITFNFLEDIMLNESTVDISSMLVDRVRVQNEPSVTGVKLIQKFASADKAFANVKSLEGLNYKGVVYLLLPPEGELNDCYFVTKLNGWYVWKYNPETYQFGWVLHSSNFTAEYKIGVEDFNDISSELCPVILRSPELIDTVLGHPEGRLWLIPASHQPGRFEGAPEMFQTRWSPLVAYYHGMFPDSLNQNYPFASLDILDMNGDPIPLQSLSLRIDGPNGLFEKKWKRYLSWRIKARPVKVKIIPDETFLRSMKFSSKYTINGVNYLLVDFKGNINSSGPGVAELCLLVL